MEVAPLLALAKNWRRRLPETLREEARPRPPTPKTRPEESRTKIIIYGVPRTHALKAAAVHLVGKEKIGAAYVTIMVGGDVAAVQAAVEAGRQTVERLEGKLIMADVITRPHPELAALLPA